MINLVDTLDGTRFEVDESLTSCIMVHVVEKRGKAHTQEIRMSDASLTNKVIASTTMTIGVLDGILRSVASNGGEEDKIKMLKTLMVETGRCADMDEATVMLAGGRKPPRGQTGQTQKPCTHCHVSHPGPPSACHALLLSKGTYPPGWATRDKDMKERLIKRAESINPDCRTEHTLTVMVCKTKHDDENPPSKSSCRQVRILVDTQAAPSMKYHFINSIDMFKPGSMTPMETPVRVTGVGGQDGNDGSMIGSIEVKHPDTGRTLEIQDCVYVPTFPENVLNPAQLERRGTTFDFTARRLVASDGTKIALDPANISFMACVIPRPVATMPV